MCIICELGKAIEGAENKMQLAVGKVSEPLRLEFRAYKKAETLADLEVDQTVLNTRRDFLNEVITEAQVDEIQVKVNAQREADAEKYGALHDELWNKIYAELGLEDRERGYTFNAETGEVTTKRRRGEVPQGAGQHVH